MIKVDELKLDNAIWNCKRILSLFHYPKSNIIFRLSGQRQSLSVFNEQIWSIKLYMEVARYSYLYGTVIFFVRFWGWCYHLMLFARCGSFWELYGSLLARNDKTVCFEGVAARFRICSFISLSTKLIIFLNSNVYYWHKAMINIHTKEYFICSSRTPRVIERIYECNRFGGSHSIENIFNI